MNNAGLTTTYEEGDKGQFELFRNVTVDGSDYWVSYMKERKGNMGPEIPKFFTLKNVELKLSGR